MLPFIFPGNKGAQPGELSDFSVVRVPVAWGPGCRLRRCPWPGRLARCLSPTGQCLCLGCLGLAGRLAPSPPGPEEVTLCQALLWSLI